MSRMWWMQTPYVTKEDGEMMKKFKYAGSDLGLSYVYMWNPLAEWFTKFMPAYVAPNTITLVAFLVRLATHLVGAAYCWNCDVPQPAWVFLLLAFGYLEYIIFDNVDGKHARNTGNSSALGMLFDHGADAFNTITIVLCYANATRTGPTWFLVCYHAIVMMGFFYATLETYHLGIMILPIINAVSDGATVFIVGHIIMAYIGNDFIAAPCILSLSWGQALITVLCFAGIGVVAINFKNMMAKVVLPQILYESLVQILIVICLFIHFSHTTLPSWYVRILIYFYGALNCKLIIHVMLAHITEAPFNQFRKSIVITCLVNAINVLLPVSFRLPEAGLLWISILTNIIVIAHMIYHICSEAATHLGIRVFRVRPIKSPNHSE